LGKTRKGGKGLVGERPKKVNRQGPNVRAGQVLWCDNCRTKGVHERVGQIAKCYDRVVVEGIDFQWVRR